MKVTIYSIPNYFTLGLDICLNKKRLYGPHPTKGELQLLFLLVFFGKIRKNKVEHSFSLNYSRVEVAVDKGKAEKRNN